MSQQPPMPDTTDTKQEKQKQERIDLVMKGLAKRLNPHGEVFGRQFPELQVQN